MNWRQRCAGRDLFRQSKHLMVNIFQTERNIPDPIKRIVRQRCHFGCVICGLPLYQYDHMAPWSEVREHKAENITLLCLQHHGEKTNKLLPLGAVIKANRNPFNLIRDTSRPYALHFSGEDLNVSLGTFTLECHRPRGCFSDNFIALCVDDDPIIEIKSGEESLLLSLCLRDAGNSEVISIKDNELIFSTGKWDITLTGTVLVIRNAHRDVFVEIKIAAPHSIEVIRGSFHLHGIQMEIKNGIFKVVNSGAQLSNGCLRGFFNYGIYVGDPQNKRNLTPAIIAISIPAKA